MTYDYCTIRNRDTGKPLRGYAGHLSKAQALTRGR